MPDRMLERQASMVRRFGASGVPIQQPRAKEHRGAHRHGSRRHEHREEEQDLK